MPAKLTGMGASATEIAERRRTALAALRRELSGDLNWIVMKAVEKARERRYQAVSDFAADIVRHMEERPVLASPPSRLYYVRKFRPARFPAASGCFAQGPAIPRSGIRGRGPGRFNSGKTPFGFPLQFGGGLRQPGRVRSRD
jgi:hypothetical protein